MVSFSWPVSSSTINGRGSGENFRTESGPIWAPKRMKRLRESSCFIKSIASRNTSLLPTRISENIRPSTASGDEPTTCFHDGLTHLMRPSKSRSTMMFNVCSAASFKSSRCSRISSLRARFNFGATFRASCLRAVTAGGARNWGFGEALPAMLNRSVDRANPMSSDERQTSLYPGYRETERTLIVETSRTVCWAERVPLVSYGLIRLIKWPWRNWRQGEKVNELP